MSRVRSVNNAASSSTGRFPSTSTGQLPANMPGGLDLYQVCGDVTVVVNHPSTKTVVWQLQGTLHGKDWLDMLAVDSTSTGNASYNSALVGLVNRVRIDVSANNTTGNVTTTWTVAGRP